MFKAVLRLNDENRRATSLGLGRQVRVSSQLLLLLSTSAQSVAKCYQIVLRAEEGDGERLRRFVNIARDNHLAMSNCIKSVARCDTQYQLYSDGKK